MPYGTIKRWNAERGFGAINDDSNPRDSWTFVHVSALPGRIAPNIGDSFSYDIAPGPDGRLCAADMRPLTPAHEEADRIFGRDD